MVDVSTARESREVDLPGRLGDPDRTLASDPRADPRMVAALAAFGLDGHTEPPPVTPSSPRDEQLEFCADAEAGFEAVFSALDDGLPPVEGVTSETVSLDRGDGTRSASTSTARPMPPGRCRACTTSTAAAWCCSRRPGRLRPLARRAGRHRPGRRRRRVPQRRRQARPAPVPGRPRRLRRRPALGDRPPRRARASDIVVSGESGGGNLTLATDAAGQARGLARRIAGVYAQCPYISNAWAAPAARARRRCTRTTATSSRCDHDGRAGRGLRPRRRSTPTTRRAGRTRRPPPISPACRPT